MRKQMVFNMYEEGYSVESDSRYCGGINQRRDRRCYKNKKEMIWYKRISAMMGTWTVMT